MTILHILGDSGAPPAAAPSAATTEEAAAPAADDAAPAAEGIRILYVQKVLTPFYTVSYYTILGEDFLDTQSKLNGPEQNLLVTKHPVLFFMIKSGGNWEEPNRMSHLPDHVRSNPMSKLV